MINDVKTTMTNTKEYKPFEAKLTFWATYLLLPLGWLVMVYLTYRLWEWDYHNIVNLSDDKGTGAYILPLFWQVGAFSLQTSYRGIFWKKVHPQRHIFDSWILITTALFYLVLAYLVFKHGHWQGVFLMSYGVWLFQYTLRRPKYRTGPLLMLKLPMSQPNLWFQIWLSKYLHYTLAIIWFLTWVTPWELLQNYEWYRVLLAALRPYVPALDVLAVQAANPDYAVGMNVIYILLLPISTLIGLTQLQVGDRIAAGIYEARYAFRYFVVCLIFLIFSYDTVAHYLGGTWSTREAIRNNDALLAMFFSVELIAMNVCLLMVGSIALGWINKSRNKQISNSNQLGGKES